MTILESYRSSTESREILRILQKSTVLQENIFWQPLFQGKTIVPIQFMEIDFISREVVLNFNSESYIINNHRPIYVKLEYRGSVFKVTDYKKKLNSLSFALPEHVKTQELRGCPRHSFKAEQEKFVTLKSSLKDSTSELGGKLNVRAMDISEYGLGLVITEQNRNFLKNNRILWITGLQDTQLSSPIPAEVMYLNSEVDSKFQIKKQKTLKVGLKVPDSFPEAIYRRFIQ